MDKDGRKRFFEENFLLADVKLDVVLRIIFLIKDNTDVDFQTRDLQLRLYIIRNTLLITSRVKLIGKKKFAVVVLDLKYKAIVVYIVAFSVN